jgi:hypothetical protein
LKPLVVPVALVVPMVLVALVVVVHLLPCQTQVAEEVYIYH